MGLERQLTEVDQAEESDSIECYNMLSNEFDYD